MNRRPANVIAWMAILVLLAGSPAGGQEQGRAGHSAQQIEYFETHIRPLLIEHCLECHGQGDQISGGLSLMSRSEMLTGGDSGPAVVAGDPDNSLLISAVRHENFEMPPSGRLPDGAVEKLAKWIEMGAPDPRQAGAKPTLKTIEIEQGRRYWSFQPRQPVQPPAVTDDWVETNIDAFVFQSLNAAGLSPTDDADRATLARRIHLTLTGLPPTEGELDQFLKNPKSTPQAISELVDKLLDSRHFGERWGRHWLDVVRFAESSGGGRSLMFPEAWRFRDYVIDSFNSDKPFNQFVMEQVAGDLLPWQDRRQRNENVVATGMLVLGPTNYELQDKELLEMEVVDEQIDTLGRAFLGLTLGCARCHDHKFDPIPISDYYALAGILRSTQSVVDGNVSKYVETEVGTDQEFQQIARYRRQVNQLSKKLNTARAKVEQLAPAALDSEGRTKSVSADQLFGIVIDNRQAELQGEWLASTHSPQFVDANYLHDKNERKGQKLARFLPRFESGGRYRVQLSYTPGGNRASNVPILIEHQDGRDEVRVNQSQPPRIDGLFVELGTFRFEADNQSAVTISTTGTDGHVIVDAIRFLPVDVSGRTRHQKSSPATVAGPESSDAESLKQKQADPTDPAQIALREYQRLNAQLQRLKQSAPRPMPKAMSVRDSEEPADEPIHIRGAVRNLGPVVPRGFVSVCVSEPVEIPGQASGRLELAEWITDPDHPLTARVYVNRIWRHLFGQGLVASTDNFGQMGGKPSHPELLDFLANRFIQNDWSTKQLIRDIMRSHVYRLGTRHNPTAFETDPENRLLWRANRRRLDAEVIRDSILFVSGRLDLKAGGLTIRKIEQYDLGYEYDTRRRSVYVPAFRNSMLELFEVFDFANPNMVSGDRNASTLPTQALFLMNDPMVIRNARWAASKFLEESSGDDTSRLQQVYRRLLGRLPTPGELQMSETFLREFVPDAESETVQLDAWSNLVHALMASIDFRYMN